MTEEEQKQKPAKTPLSTEIALKGITTDADFAAVFTALIGDTLAGHINPNVTNAACNAAGKTLKMLELRQKYGAASGRISMIGGEDPLPKDQKQAALAKLTPEERKLLGL